MYKIILEKKSESFFRKLEKKEQERIAKKFNELEKNPELGKPLTASLAGLWSLRFGDYRAIYQIKQNELVILILKLGHRKNIYD
ncbi:type II toxin-antitoxin system RelE/ParE family toxin [Candidatus Pacearchaeota archaeon]|nr:type II toxin-antitoxin system RelE/ParE family toxin [Candidatus Pacearchaeota archaeon]PIN94192.1 MAG: type II toxin-antitoxin system RelE/ParE family toxin [Candidatus Pacearchaeota archaeon CG10_big_fil_rev_8_21_14_0_10_31_9]